MTKILKVIKPFYVMEIDDTFELSQDGSVYSSVFSEVFDNQTDNGVTTKATYTSDYTISKEYAKQLIEQGYLAEVSPKEEKPFVNVFDEIDALIAKYTEDLNNLSNTKGEIPDVIKLENTTVLLNLIKVLNHLASLKK